MITYFARIGCHWIRVTTDIATWAHLPHVVLGIGCAVAAGLTPWHLPQFPVERFTPAPQQDFAAGSGETALYSPVMAGEMVARAPYQVPEPASLALLGVGVLVLVARGKWL